MSEFDIYEHINHVFEDCYEMHHGERSYWYCNKTHSVFKEDDLVEKMNIPYSRDELIQLGYIKLPKLKRVETVKTYILYLDQIGYSDIKAYAEELFDMNDDEFWIKFSTYMDENYFDIYWYHWAKYYEIQCMYALIEWCTMNKIPAILKINRRVF
ncbi:MAG TPA: hypothetical protein PK854_12520 [Oscillospiraceae bacterium]|nr:hypothetical protein [Oscillospiraceae bacterium]HPS36075.1 hypothetical protein [Oscillospiraceae bacterium]